MDFKNKVVLVTGGAAGIGKCITNDFLEKGSKVCICDVDVESGREVEKELGKKFGKSNIIFTKCDVTKDEDFEAAFETCKESLGEVNILINNAGIAAGNPQLVLDINLGGVIRGTNLAIKKMGKQAGGKGGNVVNIGSITGLATYTISPMYGTSKAGVIHFTRAMGDDFYYQHTGVMVQSLNPAFVESPFVRKERSFANNVVPSKYLIERQKKHLSAKPLLKFQDVADAVIVLLKEGKKGAAMVLESGTPLYYLEPQIVLPLQ